MPIPARSYASDALWPVIRLQWPASTMPFESVERTYADLAAAFGRGPFVVLVTFADRHPHFTAKQRQYIAKFIATHQQELHEYCKGLAIVSTEADAKGLVTALNWQSEAPFERAMFGTRRAALEWLSRRWEKFVGGPLRFGDE